jgi:hypothetical protein
MEKRIRGAQQGHANTNPNPIKAMNATSTIATIETAAPATAPIAATPKKKSKTAEFIATFIKSDGQPRTMRFACTHERLANVKPGMDFQMTVWDVENKGLRRLNLATVIGRILPAAALA